MARRDALGWERATIEIPATDIQPSAEFYTEVFGWLLRRRGDGQLAFDDTTEEVSSTWVGGRPA